MFLYKVVGFIMAASYACILKLCFYLFPFCLGFPCTSSLPPAHLLLSSCFCWEDNPGSYYSILIRDTHVFFLGFMKWFITPDEFFLQSWLLEIASKCSSLEC